jgi:molecular chaperone GrpE
MDEQRNGEGLEKEGKEEGQREERCEEESVESLKKRLKEKEEELKELQERLLYLQADFENFKKLKMKEKQEILRFGNEVLIKELLPILDNLEMALDHASKTEDVQGLREGIRLTLNEFLKVLQKSGLSPIDALGKRFDPLFHEALWEEEREDLEPGTVVSEFQKGYVLNGRVIRPARVAVSRRPETTETR